MRLTPEQIHIIKSTAQSVLGEGAQVILFGSRVDDTLKGGDIDLLMELDTRVPNKTQAIGQIYAQLIKKLGDRKIDILIKDPSTQLTGIYSRAKEKGVPL
jgi:predicted nucleotidyltransferase